MQKTGWLIYRKTDATTNHTFIQWFLEEAKKQNVNLQLVIREELQIGIQQNKYKLWIRHHPVKSPDFAIVRTIEPQLNTFLEQMDIFVFNSAETSCICNHKGLTHMAVKKLHVPMVDTIFTTTDSLSSIPPMPFPFVIKEVAGRGGKQVHAVRDASSWEMLLPTLPKVDIVIQDCDVRLGRDIRVFVVGKEIIGAVLRKNNNDFRANFKLGGSAESYSLNDSERDIVQTIINHFHFGMVGIDFLMDHQGKLLFNEIEDVVGSRTLSATSNINIVKKYIQWIKDQMR